MYERIWPRQFHVAGGVEDWRVVFEGACAHVRTGSFAAGVALVDAIGGLAGAAGYRPDIDPRAEGVTVRLMLVRCWYANLGRIGNDRMSPAFAGRASGFACAVAGVDARQVGVAGPRPACLPRTPNQPDLMSWPAWPNEGAD